MEDVRALPLIPPSPLHQLAFSYLNTFICKVPEIYAGRQRLHIYVVLTVVETLCQDRVTRDVIEADLSMCGHVLTEGDEEIVLYRIREGGYNSRI